MGLIRSDPTHPSREVQNQIRCRVCIHSPDSPDINQVIVSTSRDENGTTPLPPKLSHNHRAQETCSTSHDDSFVTPIRHPYRAPLVPLRIARSA